MFHKALKLLVAPVVLALLLGGQGQAFSFQKGGRGTAAPGQGAARTNASPAVTAGAAGGRNPPPTRKDFLRASGVALATLLVVPRPGGAAVATDVGGKIKFANDDIMSPKEHGTSAGPVQPDLRFEVNNRLADKICNFNRHFAEMGGYFQSTPFEKVVMEAKGPVTFYDSVTGKPLFVAPINRSAEDFVKESKVHGWPSFRDDEVVWENVRVLKSSGETVSVDGTHLGHNLPDRSGNRYCINLVSVAGNPAAA